MIVNTTSNSSPPLRGRGLLADVDKNRDLWIRYYQNLLTRKHGYNYIKTVSNTAINDTGITLLGKRDDGDDDF